MEILRSQSEGSYEELMTGRYYKSREETQLIVLPSLVQRHYSVIAAILRREANDRSTSLDLWLVERLHPCGGCYYRPPLQERFGYPASCGDLPRPPDPQNSLEELVSPVVTACDTPSTGCRPGSFGEHKSRVSTKIRWHRDVVPRC
jgi:hypothetical protein